MKSMAVQQFKQWNFGRGLLAF